jgi:putative polyketide hydroxylase
MPEEIPVLIVGGGPAGLTASLLLSRLGVATLTISKHTTPTPLPRARGIHARAMEILRHCGVEDDMRRRELPITPGVVLRADLATPPSHVDTGFTVDPEQSSPSDGVAISQDLFEEALREYVSSFPIATLASGVELVSVTRDGEAELLDRATGRPTRIRARYVLAADGARSRVRERLGIAMVGPADLGASQLIAFRADLTPFTGSRPHGLYVLTGSSSVLLWTHEDNRWIINTAAQPDGFDPVQVVREILGLPDLRPHVLSSRRWTAAAQTAERFRDGSVFLLGDAAHRVPPTGGTGITAAMADAFNLTWKIAAVLAGRAGPDLLDSYEAERAPVLRRHMVEGQATWERFWHPAGPPFVARSMRQLDIGYQYESPAIVPDGTPDTDPPGSDYTASAAPGRRAPHLWVTVAGARRSTLDLAGRDPVLLTGTAEGGWLAAAAGLGVPAYVLTEAAWPELYGVSPAGAVLLRPDGHVAWRSASGPAIDGPAELAAALGAATGKKIAVG